MSANGWSRDAVTADVGDFALMRAVRDQSDSLRIDLIEHDSGAFEDHDSAADSRLDRKERRRRLMTIGALVVVAIAAAVVWWPRAKEPEWRVYQTAPVPAAGLTEQLVFDDPPGLLVTADLAPSPSDLKPELGYVFGEPDGTITTRRWASFRARSTSLPEAPASGGVANVGGVPAEVRRVRVRRSVQWGPLNGRTWTVTTNLLDEGESLEFAKHVGVVDEKPALAYRYDLGSMRPVGSIAALDCVEMLTSLLGGDRQPGPVLPTMLTWAAAAAPGLRQTLEGAVSLASIAAPADALPLVEFVLGVGTATTVHGLAAVVITSKSLGPVVAWLEDGRLVMVVGDFTADELIALAESVRPATSGEWRVVGRTAARGDDIGFGFDLRESVTLYEGVDIDTGNTFAVTVQPVVGSELMVTCIEERTAGASPSGVFCNSTQVELPLLTTIEGNGRQFVLAIVDRTEAVTAALRITLVDGTFEMLPLQDFGPEVPGWAVATLLPPDHGSVELWNAGVEVASL